MKTFLFLLFVFQAAYIIFAQDQVPSPLPAEVSPSNNDNETLTTATTADGQKVILKKDFTWAFSQDTARTLKRVTNNSYLTHISSDSTFLTIGKSGFKILERGRTTTTWGWFSNITNNDTVSHELYVFFTLRDGDGIQIGESNHIASIGPGETMAVSDNGYMDNKDVSHIKAGNVEVKISNKVL